MALNANKVSGGGKERVAQPNLEPGNYPGRLVQVIDFGLQAQKPYKGEAKPPVQMIGLTYEMSDEFMIDEKGAILEDKPRWISEIIPLHNLKADKAKSTQRYHALDPQGAANGDFSLLVASPVNVTIVNNESNGKTYDNVASLGAMRPKDVARMPDLVNPAVVFLLDEPNMEVFEKFPQFIKDKILANLNYKGSALETALGGEKPLPKSKPSKAAKEEDEAPPFDPDTPEDNPY